MVCESINNVSRVFDQNVGGYQIGADKRFGSVWSGDVYLGVFGSYIYASRDFRDGGSGSTNAFSLGAYAAWIHPQGWYADMVVKYTQMWNYFRTTTSGENGSISTADYNIPTVGGSLEVGKRFDFADLRFFIEPQAQLAGVWENGMDYTAGLRVHGDDQTSLVGRLGCRVGIHLDLSQGRVIEPYAKAEVLGGGLTVGLSQSIYIYGEYDYATGDHIEEPWAVSAGFRWQW
jgi:outer membrane autotransporter protein